MTLFAALPLRISMPSAPGIMIFLRLRMRKLFNCCGKQTFPERQRSNAMKAMQKKPLHNPKRRQPFTSPWSCNAGRDLHIPIRPKASFFLRMAAAAAVLVLAINMSPDVYRIEGLATLLFDLLTADEEKVDSYNMHLRFDIGLLAERLSGATQWIKTQKETEKMAVGYFGASTGAAAALIAENDHQDIVHAIVSRGGRPDLAGRLLASFGRQPCSLWAEKIIRSSRLTSRPWKM